MVNFNENEIINFYETKVKKDKYYISKYDKLSEDDILFIDSVFSTPMYKWYNRGYSRVRTILDFREWMKKHNIKCEYLGYTSDDDPELKILNYVKKEKIHYNNIDFSGDLHNIDIKEKYDFFLFNQTIEHLYNPFLSIKNIYNSLVDGGYVFTSVPVFNIPHMTPIHFNGYTPMGLFMLFKCCGFDVIEIGQWGNFEYIQKLFNNHKWPNYNDLSENGIKNEQNNAVNCWILAKK